MSFGKMNSFVDIIEQRTTTDAEGFSSMSETLLATVRAYREDRHGNKLWANRAVWSDATSLFRFRVIPDVTVTTGLCIRAETDFFRITSVENIRRRGMYLEVLAEQLQSSK